MPGIVLNALHYLTVTVGNSWLGPHTSTAECQGLVRLVQVVGNLPAMQEPQETEIQALVWKIPLKEEMATHSSILPGKFYGQRSLVGYSPWDYKESNMTE